MGGDGDESSDDSDEEGAATDPRALSRGVTASAGGSGALSGGYDDEALRLLRECGDDGGGDGAMWSRVVEKAALSRASASPRPSSRDGCKPLPPALFIFLILAWAVIPLYVVVFATSWRAAGDVLTAQAFFTVASARAGLVSAAVARDRSCARAHVIAARPPSTPFVRRCATPSPPLSWPCRRRASQAARKRPSLRRGRRWQTYRRTTAPSSSGWWP